MRGFGRDFGRRHGLTALAAAWMAAPVGAPAQELTVSAAISLREALEEIAGAFESAHPGVEVRLNLGASGDLQRQIEAGAPVDVFVSSASRNMDVLESRAAVDRRSRRDVACNGMVVVAPLDGARAPRRLEDLRTAGRIAIGTPRTVPAGQYAQQALESGGLWNVVQSRLIFAETVRAVLQYVARGEVDAGFVYRTDVAVEPDVRTAFDVDAGLHGPIVYPAAVVAGSPRRELALAFVEALGGAAAQAALQRRGFGLPPCDTPRDEGTAAFPDVPRL